MKLRLCRHCRAKKHGDCTSSLCECKIRICARSQMNLSKLVLGIFLDNGNNELKAVESSGEEWINEYQRVQGRVQA